MSLLGSAFDPAADDMAAKFGETVTWLGTSGPPGTEITAIVDDPFQEQELSNIHSRQFILVRVSDVASPAAGDQVIVRGRTCRVARFDSGPVYHSLDLRVPPA